MSDPLPPPTGRPRLVVLAPLAIFLLIAALFFFSLRTGDPSRLPSTLIGKAAPSFKLPPLESTASAGLSREDLTKGNVTLVNVFASWCVPCREEHPTLMRMARDEALKKKGVRLVGLAYKDDPANSRRFLNEGGNPYAQIGVDETGRAGIEWGVYGVPETFVVRGDGVVAYKFIGPLGFDSLREKLMPEIEKAFGDRG